MTAITKECYELYWTIPRGNTPQNSSCAATSHPSKLDEPNIRDTSGELRANSEAMYSCGPLHMDEQRLDGQLEPIYSSSSPIQDAAWKTCRKWWTIKTGGERSSEKSVSAARNDDNTSITLHVFLRPPLFYLPYVESSLLWRQEFSPLHFSGSLMSLAYKWVYNPNRIILIFYSWRSCPPLTIAISFFLPRKMSCCFT